MISKSNQPRWTDDQESILIDTFMNTAIEQLSAEEFEASGLEFPRVTRELDTKKGHLLVFVWSSGRRIVFGFDGSMDDAVQSAREMAEIVASDLSEDHWLNASRYGPDTTER